MKEALHQILGHFVLFERGEKGATRNYRAVSCVWFCLRGMKKALHEILGHSVVFGGLRYGGKTAGRETPFGVLRSPGSPSRPSFLSWTCYNPFTMFIQPYVDTAHPKVARFDAAPVRAREGQEARAS